MNNAVGRLSTHQYASPLTSSKLQDAPGVSGFEKKPGALASLKMAFASFRDSLSSAHKQMLSSADFSEGLINPRAQARSQASSASGPALPLRHGLKEGKLDAAMLIDYLNKDYQSPYNTLSESKRNGVNLLIKKILNGENCSSAKPTELKTIEDSLNRMIHSALQSQPGSRKAQAEVKYKKALNEMSDNCKNLRELIEHSNQLQAPRQLSSHSQGKANVVSSEVRTMTQNQATAADAVERELDDILGELRAGDPAPSTAPDLDDILGELQAADPKPAATPDLDDILGELLQGAPLPAAAPKFSTTTADDILAELGAPMPAEPQPGGAGSPAVQQESTAVSQGMRRPGSARDLTAEALKPPPGRTTPL